MRRLDSGGPLRAAIAEEKTSIPKLAAATKAVDPEGRGVSQALIGFLCSTGRSQREGCLDHNGILIATALNRSPEQIFHAEPIPKEFTLTADADGGETREDPSP